MSSGRTIDHFTWDGLDFEGGAVLLGPRYEFGGAAIVELNELQQQARESLNEKVRSGTYRFEVVRCCLCDGDAFVQLASRDRYGLFMSAVACRWCGLAQTNPRMDQEAYTRFYNAEYRPLYDGEPTAAEPFFNRQAIRGSLFLDVLRRRGIVPGNLDGMLVLEVGCAAGGILSAFRAAGARVIGLDLGEEYVEYGRRKHGLDLRVGALQATELNERPDLIIYSHVLEHLLDPVAELRHVREILGDDGVLCVEVPGAKNLLWPYDLDFLQLLQNAHTYHFSRATLIGVAARAGLRCTWSNEKVQAAFRRGEVVNQPRVRDLSSLQRHLRISEFARRRLPYRLLYRARAVAGRSYRVVRRGLGAGTRDAKAAC